MKTGHAVALRAVALALAMTALAGPALHAQPIFFDDFSQPDTNALRAAGWVLRDRAGHPGVPGASWSPAGIELRREGPISLLRLSGRTDGTPEGTTQAQLCHQRKLLRGTYAARLRFGNTPQQGAGGDPVIQAFFAASPLRHDFDPQFSEIDWEYLAQGGWGSAQTRLYAIAWQTVRIEPWQAHNAAHEDRRRWEGWHTLLMQVRDDGSSHWFVDGRRLVRHGGRNQPVQPMALAFSLWFSPGGLQPASAQPRVWAMDVDWVLHVRNHSWTPAQVETQVRRLRQRGVAQHDSVPAADPALNSNCDL